MNAHQKTPLVYEGHQIADQGETISLTSLWKAEGAEESRKPAQWLRSVEAKRFIEFLADSLGLDPEVSNSHFGLVKVSRGGSAKGETFAHWQLGMAYGKYLSPKLHAWFNTVVRDVMQGKLPTGLPDDILEMFRRGDGMTKQIIHKVTVMQKEQAELSVRLAEMEDRLQSPLTCTAHDLWTEFNLAPCKGGTIWLGNRLIEMSCSPEFGSRSKIGASWRRQFDAGRARVAMRNGLYLLAKRHIEERQGQGKLRLVQRE